MDCGYVYTCMHIKGLIKSTTIFIPLRNLGISFATLNISVCIPCLYKGPLVWDRVHVLKTNIQILAILIL